MSNIVPHPPGLAKLAEPGSSAAVLVQRFAETLHAVEALLVYRTEPPVEIRSAPRSGDDPAGFDRLRNEFLPQLNAGDGGLFDIGRRDAGENWEDAGFALGASILTPDGIGGALGARFARIPEMPLQKCLAIARAYAATAGLCTNPNDGIALALGSSRVDSLTHCLELGTMVAVIDSEITRSERLSHGLSCSFIDLDGFKAVNDTEGHLAGNRVLAKAGDLLRTGARRYDHVGRFGGDEFVVVFPETRLSDAEKITSRICQQLTCGLAPLANAPVTASAGVAEWSHGESAEQLVEAADSAMREAKSSGKSRVSVGSAPDGRGDDGPLEVASEMVRERLAGARRPTEATRP